MKCSLKPLTIDEIDFVQQLAEKIWKTTYPDIISLEQIDFMLKNIYSRKKIIENIQENHFWFTINYENNCVGFTHFYRMEDYVFLSKLYVLETHQKLGIGKEVMKFIEKTSIDNNVNKIQLRVNRNNFKAIKAYQKYGFTIEKEDIFQLSEEFVMDDYIMELGFK